MHEGSLKNLQHQDSLRLSRKQKPFRSNLRQLQKQAERGWLLLILDPVRDGRARALLSYHSAVVSVAQCSRKMCRERRRRLCLLPYRGSLVLRRNRRSKQSHRHLHSQNLALRQPAPSQSYRTRQRRLQKLLSQPERYRRKLLPRHAQQSQVQRQLRRQHHLLSPKIYHLA